MPVTFTIRLATSEDAAMASGLYANSGPEEAPAAPGEFERMTQTGHAFLLAEDHHGIAGAVRFHDDEGITWFDLLVSAEPGAGRQLVLAVCRGAQDRGIRLVRAVAEDQFPLPEYFSRLGFLPVGRGSTSAGTATVTLERRLPLLTVREQRRADAQAIGELTGEDPWVFEQGARPGGEFGGVVAVGFGVDAGAFDHPGIEAAAEVFGAEDWRADSGETATGVAHGEYAHHPVAIGQLGRGSGNHHVAIGEAVDDLHVRAAVQAGANQAAPDPAFVDDEHHAIQQRRHHRREERAPLR